MADSAQQIRTNARRPVGRIAARILRKVWTLRLARTDFHDLENPDNPDAPLSSARTPSHIYDGYGSRGAGERRDMGAADDSVTIQRYCDGVADKAREMSETASYYRRIEHMAWRFDDGTERAIAVALGDGHGVRRIKADLHVHQRRVERVMKQIRIWMEESRHEEAEEE